MLYNFINYLLRYQFLATCIKYFIPKSIFVIVTVAGGSALITLGGEISDDDILDFLIYFSTGSILNNYSIVNAYSLSLATVFINLVTIF